jgi:hypothetical protein
MLLPVLHCLCYALPVNSSLAFVAFDRFYGFLEINPVEHGFL